MNQLIQEKLESLEKENGFRILYACESGSRAWGFASADSDYDIRAIYCWPRDRYLEILAPPSTIECEIDENDLDVSAWDLQKALLLFRKSNGPLMEWLHSPIVYAEDESVISQWRELVPSCFTPGHSAAHYLGLSRKVYGLISEKDQVTAKKYLYVLRSLLSAAFVVENGTPPPVAFDELKSQLPIAASVDSEIVRMISEKAGGSEGDRIERNEVLETFIKSEMEKIQNAIHSLSTEMAPVSVLNQFFQSVIR